MSNLKEDSKAESSFYKHSNEVLFVVVLHMFMNVGTKSSALNG